MFQKGSRHEIVRNCHALLVDIEAEKNNNDNVIEVVR
jgi:undecaprenyl pyrophosphate synthase